MSVPGAHARSASHQRSQLQHGATLHLHFEVMTPSRGQHERAFCVHQRHCLRNVAGGLPVPRGERLSREHSAARRAPGPEREDAR